MSVPWPRWLTLLAAASAGSCQCSSPPLTAPAPARLVATPDHLDLGAVFVGHERSASLEVSNLGGEATVVGVSVPAPFGSNLSQLELSAGQSQHVEVRFAPTRAGSFEAALTLGSLQVPVSAEALDVPRCVAPSCHDARFEVQSARCVTTPAADGTPCESGCVVAGACRAGRCEGHFNRCDDANACTVDACGEAGACSHAPLVCPVPSNPCQAATCDAARGCGVEDVLDGTLCGPDDCTATDVQVCLLGACRTRQRPPGGRCSNRWLPREVGQRAQTALAYDAARQRLVLFGGTSDGRVLADTWERTGARWVVRTPASSPPPRWQHAMAYDAARQRVVLFGGQNGTGLADTWTWDGVTWVQHPATSAPRARWGHGMAYDSARQRVVLFGGWTGLTLLADTWEWDGARWLERTSVVSPSPRTTPAMAYDAARQRVIAFGGYLQTGKSSAETWEWDGTAWSLRSPPLSPGPSRRHAMAYDTARRRLVLFSAEPAPETWEWDGSGWSKRAPSTSPPARYWPSLVDDPSRGRVVLFTSGNRSAEDGTWEWDGTEWALAAEPRPLSTTAALGYDRARQQLVFFASTLTPSQTWAWADPTSTWTMLHASHTPPQRLLRALATDTTRHRLVLFGGSNATYLGDTWEWDGATWAERTTPQSPSARSDHAVAYDSARRCVVLFGGHGASGLVSDTWEWDGTSWFARAPASAPPARSGHALAYDATRRRTVLFGGAAAGAGTFFDDTWEWDGADWTQRHPLHSPRQRAWHAMATDSARQRVVLFGGEAPGAMLQAAQQLNDTWEWDGHDWLARTPATAPNGSFGTMAFDERAGRLFYFDGSSLFVFLP